MRKLKKGFTLVELMIVVAIIGLVAAVAIPQFLNLKKEARWALAQAAAGAARSQNAINYAKHGEYLTADEMETSITLTQDQYGAPTTGDYGAGGLNSKLWKIDGRDDCTFRYVEGGTYQNPPGTAVTDAPQYIVDCPTT